MKTLVKTILVAIPVLFILSYTYVADSLLELLYLLFEATMIMGFIYGIVFLYRDRKNRSKHGLKIMMSLLVSIVMTHLFRVLFLLQYGGKPFAWGYFLKGYLLSHTLQLAGTGVSVGTALCLIIWLLRQPRPKIKKIAVATASALAMASLCIFLYLDRDLSSEDIYFEYSIKSLEDMKALARKEQKTLYIDFWHSGCRPCLAEFQNQQNFSSLVNKNTVQFLFMGADRSVPGEKQKQRLLVEKYDLKGIHSFISKEAFIEILDSAGYDDSVHGIKAFPHHMIIDAHGRVAEIMADKPSPELARKLNLMEQLLTSSTAP